MSLICEWNPVGLSGRDGDGAIYMIDYKPFQPYSIDIAYYQNARKEFTLDEWIDVLLLAVDYNPLGFFKYAPENNFIEQIITLC